MSGDSISRARERPDCERGKETGRDRQGDSCTRDKEEEMGKSLLWWYAMLLTLYLQCSYCWKEAQYNCCWNANYCNEVCQQSHWPDHMAVCTQVQQPASSGFVPRTPGSILSPTGAAGNSSSSVFMFNTPHQHADDLPAGRGKLRTAAPDATMSVQATVTPVAEPMANYELNNTMTTIEQIPNSNILFNHHSPSSPQAHYRSAIMDKNLSLHSIPPSSPHSNTSSLASIPLHPVSPASSPAHHDNVHASQGFSWPYQQPIGAIPDFPQTLPYLPQVPAATPTSQHNSFFRVF